MNEKTLKKILYWLLFWSLVIAGGTVAYYGLNIIQSENCALIIGILTGGLLALSNDYLNKITLILFSPVFGAVFIACSFALTNPIVLIEQELVGSLIGVTVSLSFYLISVSNNKFKKLFKYSFVKNKQSIVDVFLAKKKLTNIKLIFMCFLLVIVFLELDKIFYTIPFMLITILLLIHQNILGYRISKGYFGGNFNEAFELIEFILANSVDEDFFDGDGGAKRLFPETLKHVEKFSVQPSGVKTP